MLVFISDLHFVDETAGKQNIPTSAFKLFLLDIKTHSGKTKIHSIYSPNKIWKIHLKTPMLKRFIYPETTTGYVG